MPRRLTLKVVNYAAYVACCMYSLRVQSVTVDRKKSVLIVVLEHVGQDQEGRVHKLELPLPVRPTGKAAAFFRACGMEVDIDATITPEDAVGKLITARFEPIDASDDWRLVSFGALDKEARNESKPG